MVARVGAGKVRVDGVRKGRHAGQSSLLRGVWSGLRSLLLRRHGRHVRLEP